MLASDPTERMNIKHVKEHPWYNGNTKTYMKIENLIFRVFTKTRRSRRGNEIKRPINIGAS